MTRSTAALGALTGVLLLAGCAGGGGDVATSPPETTPTPLASTSPGTPTGSTFTGTEIVVAVRGGRVVPPTHRVKVDVGSQVRLLVTSDTADEVHVHDHDIELPLQPGRQATVDFTADQAGVFEIELHESGLQLVQLEVR